MEYKNKRVQVEKSLGGEEHTVVKKKSKKGKESMKCHAIHNASRKAGESALEAKKSEKKPETCRRGSTKKRKTTTSTQTMSKRSVLRGKQKEKVNNTIPLGKSSGCPCREQSKANVV